MTASFQTAPPDSRSRFPGNPIWFSNSGTHERRGARSSVWRGRGEFDRDAKATLTQHEGLLFGHIDIGNETFTIRPGPNGRTIVEKIDSDSFAPEWGTTQQLWS